MICTKHFPNSNWSQCGPDSEFEFLLLFPGMTVLTLCPFSDKIHKQSAGTDKAICSLSRYASFIPRIRTNYYNA
jgi:hypothetical protein